MVKNQGYRFLVTALLAPGCSCFLFSAAASATNPEGAAQLTQVVEKVEIQLNSVPRAAAVNDWITPETPVRTGDNSWAEIHFANETIARLGQHTLFSFKDRSRRLDFGLGAMLLQVPKRARGIRLEMAGTAAEVTNTTSVCDFRAGLYKFLVLQGTVRLYRPGHLGDSILLHAGQMVIGKPGAPLNDPVDIDLLRFAATSHFLIDFPPLPNAPLIARAANEQTRSESKRKLTKTNLVIFGRGTSVSMLRPPPITKPVLVAVPASNELGVVEIAPAPATSGVTE